MSGINCRLIVCILAGVNMFKNRIDNYLVRAGYILTFVHVDSR